MTLHRLSCAALDSLEVRLTQDRVSGTFAAHARCGAAVVSHSASSESQKRDGEYWFWCFYHRRNPCLFFSGGLHAQAEFDVRVPVVPVCPSRVGALLWGLAISSCPALDASWPAVNLVVIMESNHGILVCLLSHPPCSWIVPCRVVGRA